MTDDKSDPKKTEELTDEEKRQAVVADIKAQNEVAEIKELNEALEAAGGEYVITEKVHWNPGDPVTNTGQAMLQAEWEAQATEEELQAVNPNLFHDVDGNVREVGFCAPELIPDRKEEAEEVTLANETEEVLVTGPSPEVAVGPLGTNIEATYLKEPMLNLSRKVLEHAKTTLQNRLLEVFGELNTCMETTPDHPDTIRLAFRKAYHETVTLEKELEFQFKLLDEALTKGDN